MCPFHRRGPTLSNIVLIVINFGTPELHFIRLEAWFYAIGTLKYDSIFVFYSQKEILFWIWILRIQIFESPKSVCSFHRHGPNLLSGVLRVINFGTPKLHLIRLEAWFFANGILKYNTVFVFYSPKEPFSEFGSREFQF